MRTDQTELYRYRIPCTYRGDEAFREEAAAFVCGVITATLGAIAQPLRARRSSGRDSGLDFDVFVLLPNYLPDPQESPGEFDKLLEHWRLAISTSLEAVTWPGTSVEIEGPMLVGDPVSMRIAAERAGRVEA